MKVIFFIVEFLLHIIKMVITVVLPLAVSFLPCIVVVLLSLNGVNVAKWVLLLVLVEGFAFLYLVIGQSAKSVGQIYDWLFGPIDKACDALARRRHSK